ncbi:helix-turn-helix transcriptional regulator [Tenacibaculum sp. AHE15PA]|uniref:helix-turn-helix domain-containing protein n=1 Tax=unclassified Tenacibaculum TaxID=2635139 RepID=UPI001C4E32C0|nr:MULTISPECIES: AraC family transcriptional regulator [unclassified Tenacibaculum]QXP73694.1 helix-turn-helix transcriptional regulator [Tenacibaculum sp. AHE14PA]QXP75939.1 helix-turn-helix transcriptional regulator [Tenacibaculum sp. AHE15PA]
MNQTLHIKNMVCNRCISTVLYEFNMLRLDVNHIELGQVEFVKTDDYKKLAKLETVLKLHGFEIIKEESKALIEAIKIALVKKITSNSTENLTQFLSKRFNKNYAILSKAFSKSEGVTIEKYEILLRIEKIKEMIQLGQLNFSEIAYSLNYKSSSHLARQFKTVTGMSMSNYKNLQEWNRQEHDQIVSK